MPVTVVVGGQYGSEGKGKVVHRLSQSLGAAAVIRVGGPNSGHTSIASDGSRQVLQQLPMSALLDDGLSLVGPGSYVDPDILLAEIARLGLGPDRLCVDYRAALVTAEDRAVEQRAALAEKIGSTGSGTGAAVVRRIARSSSDGFVSASPELRPFVGDTVEMARRLLEQGRRVIVEGTQGYGLSVLHAPHYPFATSRDTSAAGAVSESGLSPLDVDDVTMVLRTFPIRVAGNSGPFNSEEVDWETIGREAGLESPPEELTSVTQRVRRVARFDPGIVRRAIEVNRPSRLVLNHLDHVDRSCASGEVSDRARRFVFEIEASIGQAIDLIGTGPAPDALSRLDHGASVSAG